MFCSECNHCVVMQHIFDGMKCYIFLTKNEKAVVMCRTEKQGFGQTVRARAVSYFVYISIQMLCA